MLIIHGEVALVMGKRNTGKKKKKILNYECNNIAETRMIKIQEEAYYRAFKRIEQEKLDSKEHEIKKESSLKDNWRRNVLFILNVLFFPWKISKKFTLNEHVYDKLLVLAVSETLYAIGTIAWLLGIGIIPMEIYRLINGEILYVAAIVILGGFFLLSIGSIAILGGQQFSKETDSNRIYAYSASIIALIGCVISIIAFLKT